MRNCYFEQNVECSRNNRKCAKCGWNPVVAKARITKRFTPGQIAILQRIKFKPVETDYFVKRYTPRTPD